MRRSGLGKGLGALIPASDVPGVQTTGYRELPVAAIDVNPYQPREQFDEAALSSLTASIREVGVLQPVLVRAVAEGSYQLIAGERRWRAAKRAGLRTIPAIVRNVEDRSALEEALVENLHREDLNAIEEAAAYQQLIDEFELTQDAVAQRVGKSRSAVTNTLRLLQLPPSIQRCVMDGTVSAGHARALLGLASRTEQEALVQRIVGEELSVREVERLVRHGGGLVDAEDEAAQAPPEVQPRPPRPAAVLEVESLLSEQLETRVTVSLGDRKGKIVIEFADLDDLDRIFGLLDAEGELA